jgi:hypothetical protein
MLQYLSTDDDVELLFKGAFCDVCANNFEPLLLKVIHFVGDYVDPQTPARYIA